MNVAIIGQGYVGLPLAIAAAKAGHKVSGVDTNAEICNSLSAGISTIEDISSAEVIQLINTNNYSCSNDNKVIKNAETVVICVPTPLNTNHEPDLNYLESACISVAENLKENALVILESTVSPGTTRNLVAKLLRKANVSFKLAYSPERIDPSNKKWKIQNTPKLVAGIDSNSTNAAKEFYESFIDTVVLQESIEVVETAKLLENTFRLINISFINELADFCHKLGIDVREVISAASTKPYGFMPFFPSIGVGGHCIPVDPIYLTSKANEIGSTLTITELASQVNMNMPKYFADLCKLKIGNLKNKRILIVGIAYKENVSDIRESASLNLIELLREQGAEVFWHDPLVKTWNSESSSELNNNYDLIILANVHKCIDTTNLLPELLLNTRGGY